MADIVDEANDRVERRVLEAIARAQEKPLDPGKPGECDFCGEWSGRLILGACAPCRDRRKLP